MGLRDTDRAACEELAGAPGAEFEAIRGFLPNEAEMRMLALEALFRSLRDIPLTVSDPAVGVAKIGWWQRELAVAREEGSQHPVVRALLETGALAVVERGAFAAYLHALVAALQEESIPDTGALHEALAETAGAEATLLASESGADPQALVQAGCAARLLELARTLGRPAGQFDWLPLDLVARHGFRSADGPGSSSRERLVEELALLASGWRAEVPLTGAACDTEGAAFLALRDRLVGRRLERAARRPRALLEGSRRGAAGDVFAAWRAARRLRPVMEANGGA